MEAQRKRSRQVLPGHLLVDVETKLKFELAGDLHGVLANAVLQLKHVGTVPRGADVWWGEG